MNRIDIIFCVFCLTIVALYLIFSEKNFELRVSNDGVILSTPSAQRQQH